MKRNWRSNLLLLAALLFLITACRKGDKHISQAAEQYTCSMHPQIVQDGPGTCPICGMDLVRKSQPGEEVKITQGLNYLLKPTNALVISSIKTILPVRKVMQVKIAVRGVITHNTRKVGEIAARFGGRIEKLFIKYNFQPIHKNQKIMEIYSPELITAQRELLYLIESDPGNTELIGSAKQRLKLLGLSQDQINKLESSKQESYSFPVYSLVEGYITEHSMTDVSTANITTSSTELTVREGMYINAGQSIFTVVSHDDLWAEFDLHQRDVPYIKLNDPALITIDNSYATMPAKVDFIQPFFEAGKNLTKVRMYLTNAHHQHHAGQLVTASFSSTTDTLIWIPSTAMLDLGNGNIAFVKRRGVFRPKGISVGRQSGKWLQVKEGLDVSDSVAYNAQFMVDSESFIKVSSK